MLFNSKLRTEIADLKAENSYFKDTCQILESKIKEQPSTSKVLIYLLFYDFFNIRYFLI